MRGFVFLATMLVLAGCGGSGAVELTDAWAGSMPPSADTAAIYLTIDNGSSHAVRIVEVVSPRCGGVELHESSLDDQQIMRMRPASEEALTIERGGTLAMAPGSFHVMCLDVRDPFDVGDEFEITVDFDDGSTVTQRVPVENR
jgi:hypothetical protein